LRVQGQPGLHSKTLSQKKIKKKVHLFLSLGLLQVYYLKMKIIFLSPNNQEFGEFIFGSFSFSFFLSLFGSTIFLVALGFELNALYLLNRHSYCLRHSTSLFFMMDFLK
jgi:hypothetical protein